MLFHDFTFRNPAEILAELKAGGHDMAAMPKPPAASGHDWHDMPGMATGPRWIMVRWDTARKARVLWIMAACRWAACPISRTCNTMRFSPSAAGAIFAGFPGEESHLSFQ